MMDAVILPMHPEGRKFVAIFAVFALVLGQIWEPLFWVGLGITVWCYYFFRDPERVVPQGENFIISPADGVVSLIQEVTPPTEMGLGDEPLTRVSVFMNVFNCHVNRFPIDCKVSEVFYKPGDFVNASMDDASTNNERNLIKITSVQNDEIVVTQVAGLVARRIVSYCNNTENYKQGQSFGIIRFGSRVDLFFKNNFKVLVKKGQTVVGGETLLASRIV